MSNEVLQAARVLIEAKKYDQARMLLKTISNDPTAVRWLAKLDQIVPASKAKAQKPKTGIFVTVGLAAIFLALVAVLVVFLVNRNSNSPTPASNNVAASAPTLSSQSTALPQVVLQTTPVPSTGNVGTRTNPIPLGAAYTFPGLGSLTVTESQWTPEQIGTTIIRLSFSCIRPATQQCDVSRMLLKAVGRSGLVYDQEFSSAIPEPRFGIGNSEVFGAATLEGYVGFQLTNPEQSLTMRVYGSDIDGDVFFNLTLNSISAPVAPILTLEGVQAVVTADSDLGSRENPLLLNTGYEIPNYGILALTETQWQRGSTGLALVKIALLCQQSPDVACATSRFLIDIVGASGAVYEQSFDSSNIPNPRWGEEVFGGGSIQGYAAFLITAAENSLYLRVRGSPVRNNSGRDELFYQMPEATSVGAPTTELPVTQVIVSTQTAIPDALPTFEGDRALLEQAEQDIHAYCIYSLKLSVGDTYTDEDRESVCGHMGSLFTSLYPNEVAACQTRYNLLDNPRSYIICLEGYNISASFAF